MNRSIICRKCQKLGRPTCTCWSERGVVVSLKDVALPAVGAKLSTTDGNTAEIARPVGGMGVQLIEACAQPMEPDSGRGRLPRGDLDRTPSRPFSDCLPS